MGTPNPGQYQPYQQPYQHTQPPPQPPPPGVYQGGYQGGYQAGYAQSAGYAPPPGDLPGTYMGHPLANWITRVGANLIDSLIVSGPTIVGAFLGFVVLTTTDPFTGASVPTGAGMALYALTVLVTMGLSLYNMVFLQGRTGQSWGKQILSIKLVRMADGQPLGPGMTFVRGIAHIADSPFFIGYLWPLWDARRQTFADKICSSLVLATPGR